MGTTSRLSIGNRLDGGVDDSLVEFGNYGGSTSWSRSSVSALERRYGYNPLRPMESGLGGLRSVAGRIISSFRNIRVTYKNQKFQIFYKFCVNFFKILYNKYIM